MRERAPTVMDGSFTAEDWAAARGEKWRAGLAAMESTFAPVDEPLVAALRLTGPVRIADIGCGGGGTALQISRRAPAGSVVRGFDLSPELIAAAQERVLGDERGLGFEVADVATALPERPYDRLVSRFGVMFFAEPQAAFTNLARWLAPDGRFAFAVWGPTADNPWIASVREEVARIVEMPRMDPDAPGPFRYGDCAGLIALLERAGFAEVEARAWRGSLPIGGGMAPARAAEFALSSFSSFAELLAAAGDDARAEAQRAVTRSFSDHQQAGVVRMAACVHIVSGARG